MSVTLYAAAGEGFGPAFVGQGMSSYTSELVADNNAVVAAATGELLAIRTPQRSDTAWEAVSQAFEQPVMLQGNFFGMLRETQDIRIVDLIR